MGECYNDMRCCDYPVSRSVFLAFLMNLLFGNEQVLTHFGFVYRLYVDYVMFLTRMHLNLEPRVYGFHLLTRFVCGRICGFSVSCVHVVVAIRVCFC